MLRWYICNAPHGTCHINEGESCLHYDYEVLLKARTPSWSEKWLRTVIKEQSDRGAIGADVQS